MELEKDTDYKELSRIVDQRGGVAVLLMAQLRDINGSGKLGSTVVANISRELENIGLGHSPAELPRDQWEFALVYRKGGPVAEIIEAITRIGEHSDAILLRYARKDNSDADTLRKIRELVND